LGELDPDLTNVAWVEVYLFTKWRLDSSRYLVTIDTGQKLGGFAPFFGGGRSWVPIDTVAWAEAYLCTKWHPYPSSRLATMEMDRKFGGYAPFLGELDPHLAMCPGPRPAYLHAEFHLDS